MKEGEFVARNYVSLDDGGVLLLVTVNLEVPGAGENMSLPASSSDL